MKDHKELKTLVVRTLQVKENYPTARELYHNIKQEQPRLVIKGFKSFVKVLNSFPEITPINEVKGRPQFYKKI